MVRFTKTIGMELSIKEIRVKRVGNARQSFRSPGRRRLRFLTYRQSRSFESGFHGGCLLEDCSLSSRSGIGSRSFRCRTWLSQNGRRLLNASGLWPGSLAGGSTYPVDQSLVLVPFPLREKGCGSTVRFRGNVEQRALIGFLNVEGLPGVVEIALRVASWDGASTRWRDEFEGIF